MIHFTGGISLGTLITGILVLINGVLNIAGRREVKANRKVVEDKADDIIHKVNNVATATNGNNFETRMRFVLKQELETFRSEMPGLVKESLATILEERLK